MRVLVSGAGGFLGKHIVARLLERGHVVRAIIRPGSPTPAWRSDDVEILLADLRAKEGLMPAFKDIDVVIHAAASTSGGEDTQFSSTVVATENFLNAIKLSNVKRLVHISSFVVYDWDAAKKIIDEKADIIKDIYDMGPYTISKNWQERIVRRYAENNSCKLTILRPGFIWGQDHTEIAGMGRRFGRFYFMFGPFTRLPLCHVVNCADCVVTAVENPAAIGEIFNVIDGDEIRVWRYVWEFARRSNKRGLLVPVPYWLGLGVAQLASLVSRALFGKKGKLPSLLVPRRFRAQFKPIRFSNQKIRQTLEWARPLSFNECLGRSYEMNPPLGNDV